MCNNVSCLRTGLSLGLELIITEWDSVLLMEMLFLDSMLRIIIVAHLAWEPISQDLSPWLHSNGISWSETLLRTCSPWLVSGWLSQDVCLGGGLDGALTTLRNSFSLFSAISWEVPNALLKIVGVGTLWPPSDACARNFFHFFFFFLFFHEKSNMTFHFFFFTFTLNKNLCLTKLLVPETVFGPRVKFYASETGNLVAPFTVSDQHHCSPGDTGGKEPACQCQRRRWKRNTFHLWVRKIPWRGKWQPTPVFLPGKITWTEKPGRLQSIGRKASDTTEVT